LAKNIKFNIKNTQLANAVQLGKLKEKKQQEAEKKPAAPKKEIVAETPPPEIVETIVPATAVPLETPPVVEIEKTVPPIIPPKEEVVEAAPPPPKKAVVVDDFRRPKIIRKTQPPPPVKKLPVSRQDAKPDEKKGPPKTEKTEKAAPGAEAATKGGEEKGEIRKAGSFKDYRDVRSQRKPSQKSAFDARDRMGLRDSDDERWRKKKLRKLGDAEREDLTIRPKTLSIRLPISVKDLAVEMKVKASQLISKLFMQGMVLTINDFLDDETTVQLLGHEFNCEITIDTTEEKRIQITDKTIKEEISATDPEKLELRPPVITFMGHVDHGKTSLIDAIRKSDLAAGEAGAITQHIGAFKCHSAVGDITILDTPGHEAFSSMRERGAVVTDLVVLVVAGDEGMRDQTIEAMNQAKEARVPILVAINKSDKPNFDANTVYRQLSEHELLPEAWGGSTITVNCSATTGAGIKELLEMLSLQSEILELKANRHSRARGSVIESAMHKGLGAVATLLVQNGTLRVGDALVFDLSYAKVKTMHDEHGKELKEVGPSTPVKITGLSDLPEAGSEFITVGSEKEARSIALARLEEHKGKLAQKGKRGLEGFLESKAAAQEKKVLNVILRADVQGSLEALKQSLQKIKSDKAELNIISDQVGQISESDVELSAASNAVILGFHTKVESHAEGIIRAKKVVVKLHNIIYHAVDEMRELLRQKLDKIAQENEMGKAEVKAVFKSSHLGRIAGCMVIDGLIKRNHHMRVNRAGSIIWKGSVASLKKVKEDVREVSKGMECGILLNGFNDFQVGDILESYEISYLEQEL
jgi:translation initiation factor IF-2